MHNVSAEVPARLNEEQKHYNPPASLSNHNSKEINEECKQTFSTFFHPLQKSRETPSSLIAEGKSQAILNPPKAYLSTLARLSVSEQRDFSHKSAATVRIR
jgi:hypothetical protein